MNEFWKSKFLNSDTEEYYPARKQLIEECSKEGHTFGRFYDNGFGWTWIFCGKCGGRYEIKGPVEQE